MKEWLTYQENIKILNTYSPQNSFKIHEVKTDQTKVKNKQTHRYNWRFNTALLAIGKRKRKRIK